MDGYAVRSIDTAAPPARLKLIGTAPAGKPFAGIVRPGETVRLFTGSAVPDGADAIVIQENTKADGDFIVMDSASPPGKHIRVAGLDFKTGDILLRAGKRLTARDVSLIAAADWPRVAVRKKPVIAVAATGDELSRPGEPRKPGGIVSSSVYGLFALIEKWGGIPRDLGIVPDTAEAVAAIAQSAGGADLIVTTGGASVGDYDLVQSALGPQGFALDFWKIAMRPGKPLIFGHLKDTPLLGLPGNPASTLVCAHLFLKPAIAALLGISAEEALLTARLTAPLKANDTRQDYIRAVLEMRAGEPWAAPFPLQDSSMLRPMAEASCLIVRAPNAPAAAAGDGVYVLPLD